MVAIPEDVVSAADIEEWYRVAEQLKKLKSKEALLRSRLFRHFFPSPKEGVNTYNIGDGTGAVLKGTYVVNRAVDPGSLEALRAAVQEEGSNLPRINVDSLVKWKPEVVLSQYRKLTDEERHTFDQCLIIKPGSSQLKVEIPKRESKS